MWWLSPHVTYQATDVLSHSGQSFSRQTPLFVSALFVRLLIDYFGSNVLPDTASCHSCIRCLRWRSRAWYCTCTTKWRASLFSTFATGAPWARMRAHRRGQQCVAVCITHARTNMHKFTHFSRVWPHPFLTAWSKEGDYSLSCLSIATLDPLCVWSS